MKCKMGGEPGTVNGLTWSKTDKGSEKDKGEKGDTNERELTI